MSIQLRDFGRGVEWRDTTSGERKWFNKNSANVELSVSGSNKGLVIYDDRQAVSSAFSDINLPTGFSDIETLYFEIEKWFRRITPSYGAINYFRTGANLVTPPAVERAILIDISDTTNYPHTDTDHIEIQNVTIIGRESAGATLNIGLKIGFLQDVDGTDGDLFTMFQDGFSLGAHEIKTNKINFTENNPLASTDRFLTFEKSENDSNWNTATNYRSTKDPTTADTPAGSKDLVMQTSIWGGTGDLEVLIGYNTY